MLPLTVGFLVAGPASGWLSDRFGARPFATGGMLVAALAFLLLELLPVDFAYWAFASLLLLIGLAMGLFASPNQMGIMNSLPAHRRGVGAGMAATFQNSAMVLSIGIFFSLMIVGLSASLPGALDHGLVAQGVPAADAARIAHLPPVGVLFASFLGYNPMQHLLGPTLHQIPAAQRGLPHGPDVLPAPDRAAVRERAARRVRLRDRRLPDRRGGLVAARLALRPRRARGLTRPDRRSAAQPRRCEPPEPAFRGTLARGEYVPKTMSHQGALTPKPRWSSSKWCRMWSWCRRRASGPRVGGDGARNAACRRRGSRCRTRRRQPTRAASRARA